MVQEHQNTKTLNWHHAVAELEAMLFVNETFCDEISKSREYNIEHLSTDDKKKFSRASFNNIYQETMASGSDSDSSYESDVDINHFIETREHAIDELQKTTEAILEQGNVRGFGDIVKFGPRNRAEETLLNSAKIFLTPSEIEESIKENKPAHEVLAKVDKGIIRDLTKRILDEERKEQAMEIKADELEDKLSKPLSMSDMSEIDGVANKVQKMASETSIVQDTDGVEPPAATPKNPDHKPKEGPDMDFYKKK